jgi:hypothetical protein
MGTLREKKYLPEAENDGASISYHGFCERITHIAGQKGAMLRELSHSCSECLSQLE